MSDLDDGCPGPGAPDPGAPGAGPGKIKYVQDSGGTTQQAAPIAHQFRDTLYFVIQVQSFV